MTISKQLINVFKSSLFMKLLQSVLTFSDKEWWRDLRL